MYRLQLTILLLLLGAATLWAQEEGTETEASNPVAEEAAATEGATETSAETEAGDEEIDVTDEEIEELLGLDEDYAEIEDEDFESTQEVRFEQNVVFPTDI